MGVQELCLLCYETQWLRHSQVERVAQSLLVYYGRQPPFEMAMYQI